jgi:hypothetical protein
LEEESVEPSGNEVESEEESVEPSGNEVESEEESVEPSGNEVAPVKSGNSNGSSGRTESEERLYGGGDDLIAGLKEDIDRYREDFKELDLGDYFDVLIRDLDIFKEYYDSIQEYDDETKSDAIKMVKHVLNKKYDAFENIRPITDLAVDNWIQLIKFANIWDKLCHPVASNSARKTRKVYKTRVVQKVRKTRVVQKVRKTKSVQKVRKTRRIGKSKKSSK